MIHPIFIPPSKVQMHFPNIILKDHRGFHSMLCLFCFPFFSKHPDNISSSQTCTHLINWLLRRGQFFFSLRSICTFFPFLKIGIIKQKVLSHQAIWSTCITSFFSITLHSLIHYMFTSLFINYLLSQLNVSCMMVRTWSVWFPAVFIAHKKASGKG